MLGGRHLPGTQEASGSGDPAPQGGLLAWWQRRSWRMDLAVLARVRDGLKRLDAELGFDGSTRLPPGDVAGAADEEPSAPPLNAPSLHAPPLDAGAETVAADPPAQDAPAGGRPA